MPMKATKSGSGGLPFTISAMRVILLYQSRLLGFVERPIVESATRQHLSIRLETKASRRSKDLPKASRVGEQEFVAAGRLLDSSLAHLATDEKPAHIPTGIRNPVPF